MVTSKQRAVTGFGNEIAKTVLFCLRSPGFGNVQTDFSSPAELPEDISAISNQCCPL